MPPTALWPHQSRASTSRKPSATRRACSAGGAIARGTVRASAVSASGSKWSGCAWVSSTAASVGSPAGTSPSGSRCRVTKPEWNQGSTSTRVPDISISSEPCTMRVTARSASEAWYGEARGRGSAVHAAARRRRARRAAGLTPVQLAQGLVEDDGHGRGEVQAADVRAAHGDGVADLRVAGADGGRQPLALVAEDEAVVGAVRHTGVALGAPRGEAEDAPRRAGGKRLPTGMADEVHMRPVVEAGAAEVAIVE